MKTITIWEVTGFDALFPAKLKDGHIGRKSKSAPPKGITTSSWDACESVRAYGRTYRGSLFDYTGHELFKKDKRWHLSSAH